MSGFDNGFESVLIQNVNLSALAWALCSTAIITTCGRLYIRWRRNLTRFDDLFNGLALLCLIAFIAIGQRLNGALKDTVTNDGAVVLQKYVVAADLLAWTTLYLVKASFLALCWSVFSISMNFRKAWWIVAAYTFLSFWAIFLSQLWQCGDPSNYANIADCASTDAIAKLISINKLTIVLHVSSDCLILALPMPMIRRLHISRAQKLSIAGVFTLVIIDIIMGVLRNVAVLCGFIDGNIDNQLTIDYIREIMSICEPSIAVVVCALPAYRVLLPSSRKRKIREIELQQTQADDTEAPPRLTLTLELDTMSKEERQTASMA